MKALTLASLTIVLVLVSPVGAQDGTSSPVVAPEPHPDRAHVKRGDSGGNVPILHALKSYQDALAVANRFAESKSESVKWQRDLSLAYSKVGDALAAGGKLDEAIKSLQDGLAIRERAAKASPSDIEAQHDLAIGRAQVAAVLAEQGDALHALELLQQARGIIAKLAERSPGDHQMSNELVMIDNNIANLQQMSAARAEAAQPENADR
jgi:tetratricopeptide (TPR) repeat protein